MSYITNSTTTTSPLELTFRDWLERVVTIFSLILISLILLVLDTTTTYWNPFSSSTSSAISTASISSSPNSSRNRIQENDEDSCRDNKTVSFATGTKFFRLPKPRSKRHLDSVLPKPSLFKTTSNTISTSTIPSAAATTAATGEFSCITLPTTPTRERLLNYTSQKKQQDSTVSSLLSNDVDWKRAHKLLQAAVQEYPSIQEQQPQQQDEEEDKDNEQREERQEVASPSCTNDSTNVLSEERNDIDGDRVTEGGRTSPMSSLFKSMSASSSASTCSSASSTTSSSSSSSTPFDEYDGDNDDDESILMIFEDPSSEDFNSGGACTPPIQATPPAHRTNEGYLKNDDNDSEILWETTESESACPPRSRVRLCFENDPEEDDSCHHNVTTQSPSLLEM
eukprot:scaffold12051_cov69-Cylindrotheca_fusiformis.AAC.1